MNRGTKNIGVVVGTIERRQGWIRMRHMGRVTEVSHKWLAEFWYPCRPDGTPR